MMSRLLCSKNLFIEAVINNLRISNILTLPGAFTNVGLHSFIYRERSCLNKLPDEYKNVDSASLFKTKLIKFKITNICNCKICIL